jgi:hypothetical protein
MTSIGLTIFTFLGALALIALAASLFMGLFGRWRRKGLKLFCGSLVVLVTVSYGFVTIADQEARTAGFLSDSDRRMAKDAGYTAAAEWDLVRATHVAAQEPAQKPRWNETPDETRLPKMKEHAARAAANWEVIQAQRMKEAAEEAKAEVQRLEARRKNAAADAERILAMRPKLVSMTDKVIALVTYHYGAAPESAIGDGTYCFEDRAWCFFDVGNIRVEIMGAGLAMVRTTNQASGSDYQRLCAVVFAALSGSQLWFAFDVMPGWFDVASTRGRFKDDIYGIGIDIKPDSDNLLECQFFQYGSV